MKTTHKPVHARSPLVAVAVSVILASCASAPRSPEGSLELRSRLSVLQSDVSLAKQIPVALVDAENAVKLAETPQGDKALAAHHVYMADRKIETARALAQARLAEERRAILKEQSDSSRLQARTREADAARVAAQTARNDADTARDAAASARTEADASEAARARSREQMAELQRQIEMLQAKTTERGIVLTLGDVLFATGQSTLRAGAIGNLDRLVSFMGTYPDRTASIEGHTDSVGREDYNQDLSLRRADAVRSYLASRGVAAQRLTTFGKGEVFPVSGNESAGGRQQNRRVDVIIDNGLAPTAAAR